MEKIKFLVDGGKVIDALQRTLDENPDKKGTAAYQAVRVFVSALRREPAVDAVEVLRCKDCKHLNVVNRKELYAHCPKANTVFFPFELDTRKHFCSLGERENDDK